MADEKKEGDDKSNGEYKPEFDVVEQPDEGQEKPDKATEKSAKVPGYEDDERLSASQRDDDDDDQDDAGGTELDKGNESQADIEAKRERRRRERKAQKMRQNAARERDQREMSFLRTRNEQLERKYGTLEERVSQNELAQVEGRLQQLTAARGEAEEVLARAIEANNGSDVVKLNRTIRELEQGINRLNAYKAGLEKDRSAKGDDDEEGQERGKEEGDGGKGRQQRPDPAVVKNLTVFAKRHPWFNPQEGDEDTRIVLALDEAVKADGYDPATKDYWVELEERMGRRLPERMKAFKNGSAKEERGEDDDEDEPQRRNGADKGAGKPKGPRMSSGSQTRGSGKQFLLSAARKQAMIEAGVWDDPELRDKYIRSYAEWDKANPAQAGRQ